MAFLGTRLCAVLLSCSILLPSQALAHGSHKAVLPESGAWFGAYIQIHERTGPDRRSAWLNDESKLGRTLALDRVYYVWDEPFPTDDDRWSRDMGRTLILSWWPRKRDRTWIRWADIAAGLYDDVIAERAAGLKAFGSHVFFSFNHEPEDDKDTATEKKAGTPAEFVAAFQHIHDRFEAAGVTNVSYVPILMASSIKSGNGDLYYPGADFVDFVGVDGYNWYGARASKGARGEASGTYSLPSAIGLSLRESQPSSPNTAREKIRCSRAARPSGSETPLRR